MAGARHPVRVGIGRPAAGRFPDRPGRMGDGQARPQLGGLAGRRVDVRTKCVEEARQGQAGSWSTDDHRRRGRHPPGPGRGSRDSGVPVLPQRRLGGLLAGQDPAQFARPARPGPPSGHRAARRCGGRRRSRRARRGRPDGRQAGRAARHRWRHPHRTDSLGHLGDHRRIHADRGRPLRRGVRRCDQRHRHPRGGGDLDRGQQLAGPNRAHRRGRVVPARDHPTARRQDRETVGTGDPHCSGLDCGRRLRRGRPRPVAATSAGHGGRRVPLRPGHLGAGHRRGIHRGGQPARHPRQGWRRDGGPRQGPHRRPGQDRNPHPQPTRRHRGDNHRPAHPRAGARLGRRA